MGVSGACMHELGPAHVLSVACVCVHYDYMSSEIAREREGMEEEKTKTCKIILPLCFRLSQTISMILLIPPSCYLCC